MVLSRWKHKVEIVSNILIYVGQRIFVASIIDIDSIIVVVICIDVVIDVQDKGDNCSNETHIAQGICTTCNS